MDSLSTGYTSHSVRGTARWQAVEFFRLTDGPPPEHTKMTDVWAFGMTVYVRDTTLHDLLSTKARNSQELLTKDKPFAFLKENLHVILYISQGKLPKTPTFSGTSEDAKIERFMWSLCTTCWNSEPNSRPSMSELERSILNECAKYKS